MNVLTAIEDLGTLAGPAHLAIGVFDGVHVGHQAVIREALTQPGTGVVVTFDPHPMQVLRPERRPLLLTSTRHQIAILRRLGVNHLLVIRFDEAMARCPAEDFVRTLQRACRPLGSIAVGRDWTFGYQARGNVALLESLGITVRAVEPVRVEGEVARSTRVRAAVAAGRFGEAARFLGRPYTVLGRVIEGRRLARQWGYPTANLALENEQLPPDGVYAVRAWCEDQPHPGVANLGLRPSIETGQTDRRLEVHLFDFAGDLYGRDLEIEFLTFLRGEQKFPDLDALRAQIARDAAAAHASFAP